MSIRDRTLLIRLILVSVLMSVSAACNNGGLPPDSTTSIPSSVIVSDTSTLTSAPTELPPSSTPEPLAALVNGTRITLAEFQIELAMYAASAGTELATEAEERVLDDLIDQILLAQAAEEQGFTADEVTIQERIQSLVEQLGSKNALDEWIETHGYNEQSFERLLARSVAAAWMRDQIAADVPETAEQTHARQILLYNSQDAEGVYARLLAGDDFGNLALEYDPLTGGDIGWFPRGYLPDSNLEEIAFNLDPDDFSSVIETLAGFHILQVLERDANRPLEPEMLLILQSQAVMKWLQERRSESDIQILL